MTKKIISILLLLQIYIFPQEVNQLLRSELNQDCTINNFISQLRSNYFEENKGQLKNDILFSTRIKGNLIYFLKDRIELHNPIKNNLETLLEFKQSSAANVGGIEKLNGEINYFLGSKQISSVNRYEKIIYPDIYNNIDLIFYFNEDNLEFDFKIHPGGDPEDILFSVRDNYRLRLDKSNNIHIENSGITIYKPHIYQVNNGLTEAVDGSFFVNGNIISFAIKEYNTEQMLVIDPILSFSTYFPGSYSDIARSIFIDKDGYIYLTGETNSSTFPIKAAVQSARGGGWSDIFISKLNKDASEIIFSTYFGGSDTESGYEIKVDDDGYIYVTGSTASSDFPIKNAYQENYAGGIVGDAFVLKLNPEGNEIIFSTYFGGSDTDVGEGIVVDSDGDIVIAGGTTSKNLPLKNAYQTTLGGGTFPKDAFVAKFSQTGSSLVFSTYFGGTSLMGDQARDVAVDSEKNIYITGNATSTDFPVINAYQSEFNGGTGTGDAFIAKFNPNGIPLYSTFFGGSQDDEGKSIVVDENNDIYITGGTHSADFPVKNEIHNRMGLFDSDVFITKIAASGDELIYSTYLGGSETDVGRDLIIDGDHNVYVTGYTVSPDFRMVDAAYGYNAGIYPPYREDAFITKLKSDGSAFIFSTFFGGNEDDNGNSIALDSYNNIYITGSTESGFDLPIKNALYPLPGEVVPDAFIAKFVMGSLSPPENLQAEMNGNNLTLSWDQPALGNFLSFNIYRSPQSPVIVNNQNLIASTTENSYSEQIIMTGNKYYYVVTAVYSEGESSPSNEISITITDVQTFSNSTPTEFKLYQNYPNPFNAGTKIKFSIPSHCFVDITILDALGREIINLLNDELEKGNYEISFDGLELSSGIYFCRLKAGEFIDHKKMILLK